MDSVQCVNEIGKLSYFPLNMNQNSLLFYGRAGTAEQTIPVGRECPCIGSRKTGRQNSVNF